MTSLDPMSNVCPTCGDPLVPVLLQTQDAAPGLPLSAEVPVVMRCPACGPPTIQSTSTDSERGREA